MQISLHRMTENIVQVRTSLSSYTVVREGETISVFGPGVDLEFELDLFPVVAALEPREKPRLMAVAAYLIASLEAQTYGD